MLLNAVGIRLIGLGCLMALGWVSCGHTQTPVLTSTFNSKITHSPCRSQSPMSESSPILQYVMYGQHTWGTRVFADGRVDEYSDQEVDLTEDGDLKTRPVPLEWRSRTQLSAAEVQRLTDAVHRSQILDLPARLEPSGTVHDGSTTVWTINLDCKHHEVTARGSQQAKHPNLETLRTTFEDIVADALNRD